MAGVVKNTSFPVFAGQVTSVFGLVGAGRTETFKVVAGALKRNFLHGGEVVLNGRPVRYRTPAPAIRDSIAYITEDRKVEGFFETMTPPRNIHVGELARSWRSQPLAPKREERQLGETWGTALNIRAVSGDVKAIELSDRILVARQGKIVEEFSAMEADEKKIMYAAIH